jgi:hypothetical protein
LLIAYFAHFVSDVLYEKMAGYTSRLTIAPVSKAHIVHNSQNDDPFLWDIGPSRRIKPQLNIYAYYSSFHAETTPHLGTAKLTRALHSCPNDGPIHG